jgi:drug/metabolite transporter (DMT)-like permease
MLVLATTFWGISFPIMKALIMTQEKLIPEASSWFVSSFSIVFRFGIAAGILFLWHWRSLTSLTRLEMRQGVGLALFGGTGILFQMDGLAYTAASTSAFLPQFYCIVIPLYLALRHRQWPSKKVLACSILVIAGVGILSHLDFSDLRLGRGEAETLLGSTLFSGQILLLEHPSFAKNRPAYTSMIMFAAMALVCLPVGIFHTRNIADIGTVFASGTSLFFIGILTVCCTLVAYMLMNFWQPHVSATEAGLIYCAEPLFASLYSLCMPAWFSLLAAIPYANETTTVNLLIGGALITIANVLIQLQSHGGKP